MKNLLLIFLALLILSSCRKKEGIVAVNSVTIDPVTVTIRMGEPARQLIATVLPDNAASKVVTWTSSDPSVATVSNGLVTPVKEGETTISARAGDITATCTVTVLPAPVAVTGISLDPVSLTIATRQTSTLIAVIIPENAPDKTIVWSSDNETIATVNNGVVTAVAVGACLITAKSFSDQTKAATCSVTVVDTEIPVTGISLDADAATILVNGTRQLNATIVPEKATNKNVRWSTSNAGVAEVSRDGLVTAKTTGSATVTATAAANPDRTATCAITVTDREIAVTGLTAIPADTTIATGSIFQLRHRIEPANTTNVNVTYESGDETKAGVSERGVVTIKTATGSATITIKSVADPVKMATCRLTIKPRIQSILVSPDAATISAGQKQQLTVTISPFDAAYKTVTWSSADESKATVSNSGEVTAVAPGEVRMTATARDGSLVTGSSLITVLPREVPVTGISLEAAVANILVNESRQLRATIAPENATHKNVTWATSNASIAEVSTTGLVSAKSQGTATVTVSSVANPAIRATCQITVTLLEVAATGLTAIPADTTIAVGAEFQLRYRIEPATATNVNVTYESGDNTKATVSTTGLVTAVAIGQATITVKSVANPAKTATCRLTIGALVESLTVSPAEATLPAGQKQQLTATVLPADAATKTVIWSSADESKATVSNSGEVTAVAPGEVRITAIARDGSEVTGSSTITILSQAAAVTVSAPPSAGAPPSVAIGSTLLLTAVVLPARVSQTVSWSSGDPDKATVNTSGMLTGVALGNVTITATTTDGSNITGSLTVTISSRATSITVSAPPSTSTPPSILTENQIPLTAIVLPANARQTVTWSSSDTGKATVSLSGVVTGVAAGNVTITATATDGSGVTGTYSMAIIQKATSMAITPENPVVGIGKTVRLMANITPAGVTPALTWTSADPSKATINAAGTVTGVALGTTTITATASDGSGVTATTTLAVRSDNASISAITLGEERFPAPVPADGATTTIAHIPRTLAEGSRIMIGGGISRVAVNITKGDEAATIKIGSASFSQGQTLNFTGPVTFTVTAPDGGTVKKYTVAITPYHATTNPYGIYTPDHLRDMCNNLTAGFKLMNDLTLPDASAGFPGISDYATAGWLPLGGDNIPFTGSLEGGGHKIDNFYTNRTTTSAGLFGKVGSATIRNLTVNGVTGTTAATGINMDTHKFVGILAGYSMATIENCHVSGDVSASGFGSPGFIAAAGGLVGYSIDGSIFNCNASGKVTVSAMNDTDAYAGGLVGYCDGNISNSYATGMVTATSTTNPASAGGLLGDCWKGDITKCYATGKVSATSAATPINSGSTSGGLVGYCSAEGTININNCFATGEVFTSCREANAVGGGLVGYCNKENTIATSNHTTTITNSYATGDVTSEYGGYYYIGGLLGYNKASTITNSYRNSNAVFRKAGVVEATVGGASSEGTAKPLAEMKTAAFKDNLNQGQSISPWGRRTGKNNDLPYIIEVDVGRSN